MIGTVWPYPTAILQAAGDAGKRLAPQLAVPGTGSLKPDVPAGPALATGGG